VLAHRPGRFHSTPKVLLDMAFLEQSELLNNPNRMTFARAEIAGLRLHHFRDDLLTDGDVAGGQHDPSRGSTVSPIGAVGVPASEAVPRSP
jgi:hypothetical protein